MDLNRYALEGVQLAGDPVKIPDHLFQELIKTATRVLENLSDEEALIGSIPDRDQSSAKLAYYGLSTLFVESTRSNSEESLVVSLLEECRWTADRVETLVNLLKVHRRDLQVVLGRLDHTHPHIVDADWKLDAHFKNNHLDRLNKSSYLISLKTEESGKEGKVNFSCTTEQLQDLVSKLKDATKSLEKIAYK